MKRSAFELFVSQLVHDEIGAGDPLAAQERMEYLDGVPLLDIQHPDVSRLAELLIAETFIAAKGSGRCSACCCGHGLRRKLPVDLELQTCRER